MPEPTIRLEPVVLTVEPGGEARAVITVTNRGNIVDSFRIDVLDEGHDSGPSRWATVTPEQVSVYPGEASSATVTFTALAGSAAPSGSFSFAVRAKSVLNPMDAAVAEGDIEVGRIDGLHATLQPMTSSGRWNGKHKIRVTNWGNWPARLRLAASDPDEKLGFLLQPAVIDVPLGTTVSARLRVKARKPFMRGIATRVPFQVVGATEQPEVGSAATRRNPSGSQMVTLQGMFEQKPLLGRGAMQLAGVGVVALGLALFLALRPSPKAHTFVNEGSPETPANVSAAANPDGTVRVQWDPVHNVEGYKLRTLTGANPPVPFDAATIDGSLQQHNTAVLSPSTKYCFDIQSFRAKLTSLPSKIVCVTTAAASPTSSSVSGSPPVTSVAPSTSPSTTPGGFAPDQAIMVLAAYEDAGPKNDTVARRQAQDKSLSLAIDKGLPTATLHTTDYPRMKFLRTSTQPGISPAHPAWLVYVPLSDPGQATTECNIVHSADPTLKCLLATPNPV